MLENTMNINQYTIEPYVLVDQVSDTEIYYGTSTNGPAESLACWRIKRSKKTGDIWKMTEFPNGDQSFSYVWADRLTYTYI